MQKQFVCRYCGKTFSTPQALSGHLGRVHSRNRDEKLKEIVEKYLVEKYGIEARKYVPYLLEDYKAIRRLEKELKIEETRGEEEEEEYEETEEEEYDEGEYEEDFEEEDEEEEEE